MEIVHKRKEKRRKRTTRRKKKKRKTKSQSPIFSLSTCAEPKFYFAPFYNAVKETIDRNKKAKKMKKTMMTRMMMKKRKSRRKKKTMKQRKKPIFSLSTCAEQKICFAPFENAVKEITDQNKNETRMEVI